VLLNIISRVRRSARRISKSSWMRSRCGSYHDRTNPISAGQVLLRARNSSERLDLATAARENRNLLGVYPRFAPIGVLPTRLNRSTMKERCARFSRRTFRRYEAKRDLEIVALNELRHTQRHRALGQNTTREMPKGYFWPLAGGEELLLQPQKILSREIRSRLAKYHHHVSIIARRFHSEGPHVR
jgi:hypothetical protein